MTTTSNNEILELITRRQRQLLVHSFLYYKLDETIIEDQLYDKWVKELVELQTNHPDLAETTEYWEICRHFDQSGSGFFIRNYPEKIRTVAFHLLYRHKNVTEPFNHFVHRFGFSLLK